MSDISKNISDFIAEAFSVDAKKHLAAKDRDFLVDYLLEKKAWKDAVIYERLIKSSAIIENRQKITAILKAELVNNVSEICRDFDGWHKRLCNRKDYGMRYGVWQKFINMTFKYLYCVKECFSEFNDIWSKCHCPIDSIIAKRLNERLSAMGSSQDTLALSKMISKSQIITWNNIGEENYEKFQEQVKIVCVAEGLTPLEFDFAYWQK
ncbi:MAG: hypothetical protein NC548_59445 [Lachnospiraceae bacterium]|nr:hypothetical protein [Lachnospiraceae bacterium]